MNDDLDIGLLTTRIRSDDAEHAQALAGQVRQLADRQLARALDGTVDRALARARLPAGAVVAVQRLDLRLKVSADVPAGELATGWAAAFEAGLARLLATIPPGDVDEDAPAAWFGDAWAAERRHLERRAAGQPDAWWAPDLAGDDDSRDPLAPFAILLRWLERSPARAVATMAGLARDDHNVASLLSADESMRITWQLVGRVANPEAPLIPGAGPAAVPPASGAAPAPPEILASSHLQASLDRLAAHRQNLAARASPAQVAPWLAALLFAAQPSASRQPAATLQQLITHAAAQPATPAQSAPPNAPPPSGAGSSVPAPAQATAAPDEPGAALHTAHAAGLLLLLRPLTRLGLLPAPENLGTALGDLALAALRRVLAPLPAGERAVAQERERPLLAVFAPECDWRDRIELLPIHAPAAANALLDLIIDAIPRDLAPAPGALRQVFGTTPPAFPTAADSRLAHLLLRPGQLRISAWEAELAWPLAAIDLALRRAGWDQDPGWLPWLGRTIRFRFGDPS